MATISFVGSGVDATIVIPSERNGETLAAAGTPAFTRRTGRVASRFAVAIPPGSVDRRR